MDNRGYESVDELKNHLQELKKHLHELYNNKINDLELLKAKLEELREKEEERIERAVHEREYEKIQQLEQSNEQFLSSERDKLNRQYEQKEQALKSRYAKMEAEFKHRVEEKVRAMVEEYCRELKRGLDMVKNALVTTENSMNKLIEMSDINLAEDSENSQAFQDNRDYTGALYSSENSVVMKIEEEFRGLLSEQDKKLESIASLINKE